MEQLQLSPCNLSHELRAGTSNKWVELTILSQIQSPQLHSLAINSSLALANQNQILSLSAVFSLSLAGAGAEDAAHPICVLPPSAT